jgi:hypothetical protein
MDELVFDKALVNAERLHEELFALLGAGFAGVSAHDGRVRVHLLEPSTPEQTAVIDQAVIAHDPHVLTARQQALADRRAFAERVGSLAWAEWTPADKDTLLRLLAEDVFR